MACVLSDQENKHFKETNFVSWFMHSCIRSGTLTAGTLCKGASKAQIPEHPNQQGSFNKEEAAITGFGEQRLWGTEQGFSAWLK